MDGLQLPKGVDKLSAGQKLFALILLTGGLYLLYIFLPPLIVILQNLWIAICLAAPLVWAAFNWELVWGVFKTLSWKLTQFAIGLSPLDVMDRYYDWVEKKRKTISDAKVDLMATERDLEQQIKEKEASRKANLSKASLLDPDSVEALLLSSNALSDQEFLTPLIPLRDNVHNKVVYLTELDSVMALNAKQLRYRIDNLRLQYESLKKTHKGMQSANDVIGGANEATKIFQEAVKQTNNQMNKMTANIENFENNIKPMLDSARVDKQLHQAEARKLLEEFKNTNFLPTAGNKTRELVRK